MDNKLLEKLSSADDKVRSAAITDAGMLSLADLRCLVDLYFNRCVQEIEKGKSVPRRIHWFTRLKSGNKTNTPREELFRLRGSLLKLLIGISPNTGCTELVLYTQSRRLPLCQSLELNIPSPILLLRFLPNIAPQVIEEWTDIQRQMLLTSLHVVRLNYPITKPDANERMPRGFPFARLEPINLTFNLKHYREEALAALTLLQRIGDERELPLVRHLAEIKPRTPIGREIQRAAVECLSFIELRAHQNLLARTLLRPSNTGADTDPNTLVRPAMESGEALPSELLRPQSGVEAL